MNSRNLSKTVICAILVLAASSAAALARTIRRPTACLLATGRFTAVGFRDKGRPVAVCRLL